MVDSARNARQTVRAHAALCIRGSSSKMHPLPFLTSWDPTDLPGTSVDPLGFDRAYTYLSDLWLPGLTNVASQPRYFSLLCAGLSLAPEASSNPPDRKDVAIRQECVLRLERLWALAHAARSIGDPEASSGVRGATYAAAHFEELRRRNRNSSSSAFKLLLSQTRYGVLGIYGTVAAGLRLTDGVTLSLTTDLGDEVAAAFLDGTETPVDIRKAVADEAHEVDLEDLAEWAGRAGVRGPLTRTEHKTLVRALKQNPTRERVAWHLARTNWRPDKETELEYLERLGPELRGEDQGLGDVAQGILLLEACYRRCSLVLDRVLWACDAQTGVALDALARDRVLRKVVPTLPEAAKRVQKHLEIDSSGVFRDHQPRTADLLAFLDEVRTADGDIRESVCRFVERHSRIQSDKIVRGRSKLPWLERVGERLQLTTARARESSREPETLDDSPPHSYRLHSAREILLAKEART